MFSHICLGSPMLTVVECVRARVCSGMVVADGDGRSSTSTLCGWMMLSLALAGGGGSCNRGHPSARNAEAFPKGASGVPACQRDETVSLLWKDGIVRSRPLRLSQPRAHRQLLFFRRRHCPRGQARCHRRCCWLDHSDRRERITWKLWKQEGLEEHCLRLDIRHLTLDYWTAHDLQAIKTTQGPAFATA